MRAIQLHTAALDKRGVRREAGEVLHIGESDEADILPDDAKALVERGSAAETRPVEPETDVELAFSAGLADAVADAGSDADTAEAAAPAKVKAKGAR